MNLEEIKDSSDADIQEIQDTDIQTKTENPDPVDLNLQNNLVEDEKYIPAEDEKELYEEILKKLDITLKTVPQDNQKTEEPQATKLFEEALKQDFIKIQKLVQGGLVNSVQGQNLKKQVLKKAFDKLVQTEKIKRSLPDLLKQNKSYAKSSAFEEFSINNPDFFNPQGRKEVLNYLKSDGVTVGKDELNKISEIIRIVEKSAIDRYLQKAAHEKVLRNSNESAKQKLTANAQKLSSSGNLTRSFTREQIGKMSGSEFAKYERAIMEQLKKGQIK